MPADFYWSIKGTQTGTDFFDLWNNVFPSDMSYKEDRTDLYSFHDLIVQDFYSLTRGKRDSQ
ncbi:hypothetical protein PENTCL1PPCAC_3339 [Pristionchus entomophagus]|uniref:Uncharacterized protein n=1 Tax=Pristionchus entomophagus TaxID=358040 RepID=A0AAV5SIC6_9BILA|nr:hypothetical protein PENTCL1PPCAC_3339 [Pristionchus entomophagus]